MYKTHSSITISPPLGGYSPGSIASIAIANVVYSAIARQAFNTRARLLNGVADGYSETNSAGTYYLAPVEDPGACGLFYNTAQTAFYKNNCAPGQYGSLVSYTVPANTYSSAVSQAYADAAARVQGQAYANANGTCSITPPYVNVEFELIW